ncbi:MAG TPA: cytochrome oxidase subunit III [Verrucomicrobiales bacterium]|nr:cytochrome oxidase subunit III [Verrucomicrobiales bacterium]HIL70222.1 cytochrome oxidase subunit III [Verrucomicrobiota bacterium]
MSFEVPVATRRSVTGIPTGRLGIWWVVASEIVIFGGLIVSYTLFRLHHAEWAHEAAHTSVFLGALNTLILLSSSFSVVLAHKSIVENRPNDAVKFLKWTILGGLGFLVVKSIEYTTEISHGYTLFTSVFWSFYYIMTGLHATHVVAGMVAMGIVAQDVKNGKNLQRVEYVGIYWHFVDVVWIFLFPLLYIASGL